MAKKSSTTKAQKTKSKGSFSSFVKHLGEEWGPLIDAKNEIRTFAKGDFIFQQGQAVNGMYCINTGKVKISAYYEPEGEHILRLAKDGDIVGLRGVGSDLIFPVSAVALTDCTLSFLPISVFMSLLKTNIQFCFYFMNLLASELRKSEQHNKDMARMEMRERIAMAILNNLEVFGCVPGESGLLTFTMSRKDFSSIAGTTYETVIRMLAELEKMKLIRLEGKSIRVLNENGLLKLVK